jgi:MinD-like ATPase involved in chromosome partitioning or flagellar assembly
MSRILVWNINGNAGKSTNTNMVFYPRLKPGAEVIYVESDNSIPGEIADSKKYEATAEEWAELVGYLAENVVGHDIIVDIGSSDSKKTKALFKEFAGSLAEFDLFIVPHSPDCKSVDTALTIDFLQREGIEKEKIKMIFNMVPTGAKLEKVFPELFDYHKQNNNFVLDESAVIYKTTLLDRIKDSNETVESIVADNTDYQKAIIEAHPQKDDPQVKEKIAFYSWMKTNKMLAKALSQDFDKVFKVVMGS